MKVEKTHHDSRKVDSREGIQDEEERGRGEWPEEGDEAGRHEHAGGLQVCEVGGPGRRLMLADRGNDGDVLGGIGGIQ